MRLNELMNVLGFGEKVIVIETLTDDELLNTKDFKCPYVLKDDVPSDKLEVQCVGTPNNDNTIMIWVKNV